MKFTKNQSNAIHTFGKNLSVSAGAGSGKTTVLVSKYSELIELKKAQINEILAITFTNKAAQDMRRRVRELVDIRVSNAGSKLEKSYWNTVKSQLDSAQITTIHSFGLNVLQKYPLESNVHPEVTLLDEIQALLALQDVTKLVIAAESKTNDSLKKLIQQLGSSKAVIDSLVKVYLKARSLGGEPTKVSQKAIEFMPIAKDLLKVTREEIITQLQKLKDIASLSKSKSKFIRRWQELDVSSYINTIVQVNTLSDFSISTVLQQLKDDCSRPPKDIADLVKSISYKSKSTGLLFTFESLLSYFDALPIWNKVNDLISKIDLNYMNAKKQLRALDYSDLEWGLLKLLSTNKRVREEYQEKFQYIMVDEFQDTSPLQQQLIKYLAPFEQNKLFIVGDARQSIYRFRAAEVEGFMQMEESIIDSNGERIILEENFRSQPQLIEFFNGFFAKLFEDTPIVYDKVLAGRTKNTNKPLVELWVPPLAILKEGYKAKERHELEAKILANNIIKINQKQGVDFGDIAILFRALTDVKTYERQLQKQNIPYVVVGSRGFFARQEVVDLINLLTYFVYSKNKIALVGVLRSPLLGLSDEGLYYLTKEKTLIDLLPCNKLSSYDTNVWLKSIKLIKDWRTCLSVKPISAVIQQVIDDTNYKAVLLGSPGYGMRAVANIEKFINTILKLEQDGITSKVDILRYLEALKDSDAQFGEAVVADTKNAVQIMTVHQSKGLEFNTVIIAQCERESRNTNTDILQYTKDFGLVVRKRNWEDRLEKNIYYNKMNEFEKQKELEESYRLLYVAATRAENKLIFSAVPDKWPKEDHRSWLKLLVNYLELYACPSEDIILKDLVTVKTQIIDEVLKLTEKNDLPKKMTTDFNLNLMQDVPKTYLEKPILTASALIDYSVCPKMFYYKNIQKLAPIDNLDLVNREVDKVLLGEIVHKVCEQSNNKEDLYNVLKVVLNATQVPNGLAQGYYDESVKVLTKYENSDLLLEISNANDLKSEIPFSLKHQQFILSGVIDKIIITNNLVKIIDFKSGAKTQAAIDKYRVQIALYALALKRQFNKYPNSLIVYFMMSGKEHDYITDLKDEQACIKLLSEVVTEIDNNIQNNDFLRQEAACIQCKYQILCKNYN